MGLGYGSGLLAGSLLAGCLEMWQVGEVPGVLPQY